MRYDLTQSTEGTADLEETDSGVTEGSADGLASDAEADPDCAARASVSVARSSLCMPALFCFKVSSPPPRPPSPDRHTHARTHTDT